MTNEQRLKVNIAAYRICDGKVSDECIADIGYIPYETRRFNIFCNPADCLAVVKKLGDLFQLNIIKSYNECSDMSDYWFWTIFDSRKDDCVGKFDTYEEAVAAAVMVASNVDI